MASASASLLDGTPDGAAFGEFLRQARERRGLTLQEISSETKIPRRHLEALEHGRLNAVPGGTYRRGEIRAYAEVVGLDKALALERLDRALQASTATAPPQPRTASPAAHRGTSLLLVTLIAIAAAMLLTLWNRPAPSRSSLPPRLEPLAAERMIAPSTPMPPPTVQAEIPIVQAEIPSSDAIAASAAPEPATTTGPGDGSLEITSEPAGARVTVDGVAWGVTPVTIRHLSSGNRRVRVTAPDFAAAERSVRMPDDRSSSSLHVVLTPTGRK